MDVKRIVRKYHDTCRRYQLSDEYLQERNYKTRIEMPIAAEFCYGVVHLRDDAADVLIKRIEELEAELQELRGTIKVMEAWERRVDKAR